MVSGDIASGAAVKVFYDGTNFQLLSDSNGLSETVSNLTVTSLTSGRVTFAGTGGLLSDNANLYWDNTNNYLGIGTSSPTRRLYVKNADSDTISSIAIFLQSNAAGTDYANLAIQADAANNLVKLISDGTVAGGFAFLSGGSTERIRIDSAGNLGIGTTSPIAPLSVVGNILAPSFNTNTTYTIGIQDAQTNTFVNTKRGNLQIQASSAVGTVNGMGAGDLTLKAGDGYSATTGTTSGNVYIKAGYNTYNSSAALQDAYIAFFSGYNAPERMRIDSAGNLGLGVTPSAWGSGYVALQLTGGSINSPNSTIFDVRCNSYYNGTADTYKNTGFATMYRSTLGIHQWFNAPSGTAGNPITFTQAMTLDASGNLGIGTTPSAWDATYKVAQVSNGSLASSATSTRLGNNYYYSGGYKYAATAASGLYSIDGNSHAWYIAASGTAGTAITYTNAMTLDTNGNLGIGATGYLWSSTQASLTLAGVSGSFPTRAGVLVFRSQDTTSTLCAINSLDGYMAFYTGTSTTTTERMRIDSSGNVLVTGAGGLGYGTGSGGAVTQITSRTTGVTLNKTNGAITLFSAAGVATAATFTVTNSTVAATDTIIVNQKSGTNFYVTIVTAVAAGSFNITFFTTGGTATDAPVFNYAVIKAVTA